MNIEIIVMLLLLCGATLCFAFEWLRVDVVTLILLATLSLTGILTPSEAFSGFSSDLIVILTSIFVIGGALAKSGVMQWLGKTIESTSRNGKINRPLLSMMGVAAGASALISNTSATAVLMPAAMEVANRLAVSASRFLMPLVFASILGGVCTLIGTSTNLAGSSMVTSLGLEAFSLTEFVKVGALITAFGIVYLMLAGSRLVPSRRPIEITETYGIQAYLSEVTVPEKSSKIGKRIGEIKLFEKNVSALVIVRDGSRRPVTQYTRLQKNDTIVVKAQRDVLLEILDRKDFQLESERTLNENNISPDDMSLSEGVIMPQSRLLGKTLKEIYFFQRFGVIVLGILRREKSFPVRIDRMPLQIGDVLLMQGGRNELKQLKNNPDLWGLVPVDSNISKRNGTYALVGLAGAVILGALEVMPLSIAFLLAALSLVISRGITMEEAYGFIEWRLIILIAGMTGFGLAMQKTGTADLLAGVLVELTMPMGIYAVMAGLAIITVLLTQPMSNAAAALVVIPVAVAAAEPLGVDPRSLAILVTLAASVSFITPLEPASLLVYGAGNYRFLDFVKVGLPLTLGCIVILIITVPIFWPL